MERARTWAKAKDKDKAEISRISDEAMEAEIARVNEKARKRARVEAGARVR